MRRNVFDLFAYCVSGNLNGWDFFQEFVKDNVAPEKVAFIDGIDQAQTFCRAEYKGFCEKGYRFFSREPFAEEEEVEKSEPKMNWFWR